MPILLLSLCLSGLLFIGNHFVAMVSAHISPMGMLTLCCPSSSSLAGRERQPHCCKQSQSNFHCWWSCMWKEELWLLFLSLQKESCSSPLGFVRHHPSRAAAASVNRSRVLCLAFTVMSGRGMTQFPRGYDERQVLSGSCLCEKCSLNIWQRKQSFFDTQPVRVSSVLFGCTPRMCDIKRKSGELTTMSYIGSYVTQVSTALTECLKWSV